ncbi:hypothetical protein ABH935_007996 [Catenulispora sp. GAS73]|uniref:hypothetical protein n=1 Tax=Catenulispora sp. GAS73 TaxID=3156269 RepID=UPI0035146BEE
MVSSGEVTIRADRGTRIFIFTVLGLFLAVCAALAVSSLVTAHTVAPRDGMSVAWFDVRAVTTAVVAMTLGTLLTLLCLPTYLGTTCIRDDGLLIAKPCRRARLLPWSEVDYLWVDAVAYGRGVPTKGLRAVSSGHGQFLPGIVSTSRPDFQLQVQAVEAAWRLGNPQAVLVRKGDPTKNKARSRLRRRRRR